MPLFLYYPLFFTRPAAMSWIFGCVGDHLQADVRAGLSFLNQRVNDHSKSPTFDITWGGLPETNHAGPWECPQCKSGGWVVVGVGLHVLGTRCEILSTTQWQAFFEKRIVNLVDLDGHFVASRWCSCKFEAWTDPLGVRTLYFTKKRDHLYVSTRLDWLAQSTDHTSINWEAFGAHWLAFNQFSSESLVEGIDRLGAGGHLVWDLHTLEVSHNPWHPVPLSNVTPEDFLGTLKTFLLPADRSVSLGLSGGLDSRLLLSLGADAPSLQAHSFGSTAHPDVKLAQSVAASVNCSHRIYHEPVPDAKACLDLTAEHVAQTQAVSSASSSLGLRYYPSLYKAGNIIVDGGFGEVARRQFMNRLLRKNKNALLAGNVDAIVPHVLFSRADVFSHDVNHAMREGLKKQIRRFLDDVVNTEGLGPEMIVDLWGVRARLPNFFGYEQSRLDRLCVSYMPFAQPSLLKLLFNLPLSSRQNGRLFRFAIRKNTPQLARLPLVKGARTYPFRLGPVGAFAWTKLASVLFNQKLHTSRYQFVQAVLPLLPEIAKTAAEQTNLFNPKKIDFLLSRYKAGHHEYEGAIDWWLAFELWRRSLTSPESVS